MPCSFFRDRYLGLLHADVIDDNEFGVRINFQREMPVEIGLRPRQAPFYDNGRPDQRLLVLLGNHRSFDQSFLGYFILPFDLVPESVLPIIGFTDDVAVMTFVLKMVKDSITPEIRRKADQKILDLFPDPA